jgi:hypothetical protein
VVYMVFLSLVLCFCCPCAAMKRTTDRSIVLYIMKIQWFFAQIVLLFCFTSGANSHRWLKNDSFSWACSTVVAIELLICTRVWVFMSNEMTICFIISWLITRAYSSLHLIYVKKNVKDLL